MEEGLLRKRIEGVARRHPEYDAEGYFFVHGVLAGAVKRRERKAGGSAVRVSVEEFAQEFRGRAAKEFGVMAREVMEHWGMRSWEDVGRMVHFLAEEGVVAVGEEDGLERFCALRWEV